MTDQAEIVVVGGGAVGCGVAHTLARAGKTDVLLLEREPTVAAVTTSQAAGLVGQVRDSVDRTRLAMESVETFAQMEREEQVKPGWRQVGSLRIALSDRQANYFHRLKSVAAQAGLEVEFLDQRTARDKWPLLNFERAREILWCPSDGYLQPSDLTMAYVTGARRLGVRFQTNTRVIGITVEAGRVRAVETDRGSIRCQTVINAAGANAYHLASGVGLELPIIPVRHQYFVTVPAPGLEPGLPVVRIPDLGLYLRAEIHALLCGGWESSSMSLDPRHLSTSNGLPTIESDWDVLGHFGQLLAPEIPQVQQLGIRNVFKGWPTFTPDGRFIIGESKHVRGFVMAGGCNAHGVSGSAGIGRHVVESMLDLNPSPYVKSLSPDRFCEQPWDWKSARLQAQHYYESYYELD
jgi:glycine/D-amino acid oxidase-like deaminating enzyme